MHNEKNEKLNKISRKTSNQKGKKKCFIMQAMQNMHKKTCIHCNTKKKLRSSLISIIRDANIHVMS